MVPNPSYLNGSRRAFHRWHCLDTQRPAVKTQNLKSLPVSQFNQPPRRIHCVPGVELSVKATWMRKTRFLSSELKN